MGLNLLTLRRMVRERMGVPASDAFLTDNVIDNNINLAIAAFDSEQRWPWNEHSTTLTIAAGTNTVDLPDDWAAVRAAVLDHEVLEHMPIYDMDRFMLSQGGPPRYYTVIDRTFRIAPHPSQAHTITLYYYRVPYLLENDKAETRIPDEYVNGIVNKACQLCSVRESDRTMAADFNNEYSTVVRRALHELSRNSTKPVGRRIRPGAWV